MAKQRYRIGVFLFNLKNLAFVGITVIFKNFVKSVAYGLKLFFYVPALNKRCLDTFVLIIIILVFAHKTGKSVPRVSMLAAFRVNRIAVKLP